jgi:hypothetical protein
MSDIDGVHLSDFNVGDLVEWSVWHGNDGIERGVVSSITERKVYVRTQRVRLRGRGAGKVYDCEFYWRIDELAVLRRKPRG